MQPPVRLKNLNAQPARVLVAATLLVAAIGSAHAALPPAERTVLDNLYTSTNGASWLYTSGWEGGAGTECSWYGIICDADGNHVIYIDLSNNFLSGSLPADLAQLTALDVFRAQQNQLIGPLPSLAGLTALLDFNVSDNQLTGSIPPLAGLTALQSVEAQNNQLTGSIPALTGLTALQEFTLYSNQLTGPIPALSGLTSLQAFDVGENQLTGSIPSLDGLTALRTFSVSDNQITGSIPSLADLSSLRSFYVANNQLSGPAPVPPPQPLPYDEGYAATLCPNLLGPASTPESAADVYWDNATGNTPWTQGCTPAPVATTATPTPTLSAISMSILLGLLAMAGCGLVGRRAG